MRKYFNICFIFIFSIFLIGCSDTLNEISNIYLEEKEIVFEKNVESDTFSKDIDEEESDSLVTSAHFRYGYDNLTESEQIWYSNIKEIIEKMQRDVELSQKGLEEGLDETDIDKIFQCVLMDYPEYFYVEGYSYTKFTRGNHLIKIEFSGNYSMNMEKMLETKLDIEKVANSWLIGIDDNLNEYEKVLYVYETIIQKTEYNLESANNQNIISVFLNEESVCQGYAKATQYLLNFIDIDATLVIGVVGDGEGHAWNLVKVDGQYYYLDSTWGDGSFRPDENDGNIYSGINYDYFCINQEQLNKTHKIDMLVPLPICTSTDANYYLREGLLFTEVNEEQLVNVFKGAVEEKGNVTLKAVSEQVYTELHQKLIKEQGIFSYLTSNHSTISYTENEKQWSLTFWMTK